MTSRMIAVLLCSVELVGCGVDRSLLAGPTPTAAVPLATAVSPIGEKPTRDQLETFRQQLLKAPPPAATTDTRCFSAHYPSVVWTEEACGPAPTTPNVGHKGAPHPDVVGDGTDFFAFAPVGHLIIRAAGSFDDVDVKGENGVRASDNQGHPNTYSIQLNSNRYTASACKGIVNCAWAQFVYSTSSCSNDKGCIYIQYWLFRPKPCPSGWSYYDGKSGGELGCFHNSHAKELALQSWTELRDFWMSGLAGTANDGFGATTAAGEAAWVSNGSNGLDQNWTGAEFNLVGDGNGTGAIFFNGNSTLQLHVELQTDSTDPITCSNSNFNGETGEFNNLTLTGPCTVTGSSIDFVEAGGIAVPQIPPLIPCAQLAKDVATQQSLVLQESEHPPACPSGIVAICSQTLTNDAAVLAAMKADYAKRCGPPGH
jgi:hypothetical protein